MRLSALATAFAFFLTACAGGSSPVVLTSGFVAPQLQLTASTGNVVAFTDAAPLVASQSGAVVPLLAVTNLPTTLGLMNVKLWGTKDGAGQVLSLYEAGISGIAAPPGAVHVFFDNQSRPVIFRDDATGYSLQISYDSPGQVTATVCDPQNTFVGAAPIVSVSGSWLAGNVRATGTCVVRSGNSLGRTVAEIGIGAPTAGVAATSLGSLNFIAKFVTAVAYVGGLGFAVGAILKFRANNPTQVPISQPIALLLIAAALLVLPSVFSESGKTLFSGIDSEGIGNITFVP